MAHYFGDEDIYCIVIAVGYLCLSLLSTVHLSKIILYGHNPFSFHMLFGVLTFLWTVLRAIFFGLDLDLSEQALFLLYWIPLDLEWAVYLLILVFYIYWIQDDALMFRPSRRKKRLRVLLNLVYVFLVIASFVNTLAFDDCAYTSCDWNKLNIESNFFVIFQYVSLCLIYTGVLILIQIRRCKQRSSRSLKEEVSKHGTLNNTIVGRKYMFVFWVIFTGRLIYHCGLQAHLWNVEIVIDQENRKSLTITSLAFLCLWELVPTAMVLWCFRSIPTNHNHCVCCMGKNYSADYVSLRNNLYRKEYFDTNQISYAGVLGDPVAQQSWHAESVSTIKSTSEQNIGSTGGLYFADVNGATSQSLIPGLQPSTTSQGVKTEVEKPNVVFDVVNEYSCSEIGPEFRSDQALERSPVRKSRKKRRRSKRRKS